MKWQSSTARSASGFFETLGGRINIQLTSDGPVFLAGEPGFGPDFLWRCKCKPCLEACGRSLFLSNSLNGLFEDSRNKTYSFSIDKPVPRVVLPIYSMGQPAVRVEYTFSQQIKMVKKECPIGDFGSTLGLTLSANKVSGRGESSVIELDGAGPFTEFSFSVGDQTESYTLVHIGIPCNTQTNPLP